MVGRDEELLCRSHSVPHGSSRLDRGARDREIDQSTIAAKVRSDGVVLDRDVHELSHQLWAFLNLNLTGNHKKKHQAVRQDAVLGGHGMEVWRKVVCPLVSKSEERRHELYDAVILPKALVKFAAVMEAIEMWKENIRFYQAVGGRARKTSRSG